MTWRILVFFLSVCRAVLAMSLRSRHDSSDERHSQRETAGAEKAYSRLHPDPVEDNYQPEETGRLARVLSIGRRILPWAAAASVLIVPVVANAAPLGKPLDDVSDSSPASSYAAPAGFGNLTGADGDVANPQWIAVTDSGFAHIMNGANATPLATIDTGISGLTGVAITGYDGSDFLAALCAGTTIYEGKLSQTAWTQSGTIDLTTSNLTDIDRALGAYFIATESDGIRKVTGGGTSAVDTGAWNAYDVIEFLANTYDNNMSELNGQAFKLIDVDGIPLGGVDDDKTVNWSPATTIRGIAYYDGGIAVVQNPGVHIHNEQAYQQHMQPIPEPATIALLLAGGAVMLGARYRKQGSGAEGIPDKKVK